MMFTINNANCPFNVFDAITAIVLTLFFMYRIRKFL